MDVGCEELVVLICFCCGRVSASCICVCVLVLHCQATWQALSKLLFTEWWLGLEGDPRDTGNTPSFSVFCLNTKKTPTPGEGGSRREVKGITLPRPGQAAGPGSKDKSLPDAAPFGQRRIDEMIAASNDVELLLRNAVARFFIAEALLPIRLVEDPSFTELLDLCFAIGAKGRRNSQEMLGKRKGFTQHCDVLYESLLTKSFAEKIMAGPDKFTLTFDF